MKKIGLLLVMAMSVTAVAQEAVSIASQEAPQGTLPTTVSFPTERVQTPTYADLYCSGFLSPKELPDASFVAGGLQTPTTTKFVNGDMVYLAGGGYQTGQEYTIVRELRDVNEYQIFAGQRALIKATGRPYGEEARVRIVDTRSKMAIAQIEFSCDPVNPGDFAVPFVEKQTVAFHPQIRFDRFLPHDHQVNGRILMAKDFDSELGTGLKVYMNVGSNQGVKVGDYFRAVRSYTADLHDPVDSLSFKASTSEDTQKKPPSIEPNFFNKTSGAKIHVADLPRRSVGEIVIIGTTPTTSTGMIVFALEDVHLGDDVELDPQ
ncbi:MAG: hypothetical protein ACRD2U_16890 [Terriglobales bacterium]